MTVMSHFCPKRSIKISNGDVPSLFTNKDVTRKPDKQSKATLHLYIIVICHGRCIKPVSYLHDPRGLSKYLENVNS